jgi:hypothetical protein
VRQSTMGQVAEHTESQRRQYGLADSARSLGFASVSVIDDDLGRSGSGLVEAAQLGDAVLAAQTGQHNADLLLRRKLPPGGAADRLHNLLRQLSQSVS